MVAERIRASDDELAQISGAGAEPPTDSDIPPEALVVGWTYDVPGSVQPRAGHVSTGQGVPTPGTQQSEWTMRHAFKVYLDNSAIHPRGDFQIITHDFSGSFNPASTGQFFQMFDLERAWWTGVFGSTIAPADTATSSKLSFQKSEPPTENQATQVSSSESFDVGVAASKEGKAIDVSYNVSHGREFSIADWSSINTSAAGANRASWQFSSRQPCDPRPEASPPPEDNCFHLAGTFPNDPNLLSKGQITVDTSARWSTGSKVLTPGNGELSFAVDTPVTLIDLYCGGGVLSSCTTHNVDRQQVGPGPKTYTIDASDSLPVPVDSVDLKPTTANGKNNEVVEGTVKLQRKVPFDTTIVLYSTRENAFLEEPVTDQISKEEITINKGDDTGTFEVQTNANNLKAGNEVIAYITAFYGGASEPAALTVQRPAS